MFFSFAQVTFNDLMFMNVRDSSDCLMELLLYFVNVNLRGKNPFIFYVSQKLNVEIPQEDK